MPTPQSEAEHAASGKESPRSRSLAWPGMAVQRDVVMDLPLCRITFQEALEQLCAQAAADTPGYACFANVHMFMEAQDNELLARAMRHAPWVFTDGKPLCWALKLTRRGVQERIAGMDMMPALLAEAALRQLPVYFLGGTAEVNQQVVARAKQTWPSLLVAGAESPPFRPLQPDEDRDLVNRINGSGAKLLFVALGCPKQEIWMHEHRYKVKPLMLGVGGAFPVFARLEARAPRWAQQLALEWLWRLLQDPKRLWKRYLYTNTRFLALLLLEILGPRHHDQP